jgi:hypothetical protein
VIKYLGRHQTATQQAALWAILGGMFLPGILSFIYYFLKAILSVPEPPMQMFFKGINAMFLKN